MAIRIACGCPARRGPCSTYAPCAHAGRRAERARSSTGSFWRVSTSSVGPSVRSIATRQASTVSVASAGRSTTRLGMARSIGQVLDRLVRRSVLAHADRVVGADVDDRQPHDRREADRRLHVVGEDEEGAAEAAEPAVGRDAVQARGHPVLADAPVEGAARGRRPERAALLERRRRCCRRGRRSRRRGWAPRRRWPAAPAPEACRVASGPLSGAMAGRAASQPSGSAPDSHRSSSRAASGSSAA